MEILDLGRRVELLSMDPHFHDISIAVYRTDDGDGATYLLHSYSKREGSGDRLAHLAGVMQATGGMVAARGNPLALRFACGHAHETALKRLFVESCKVAPGTEPARRELRVLDKKNALTISAEGLGGGRYRCSGDRDGAREQRRVAAVAAGLGKLAELDVDGDEVRFPCATDHDELIGLLMVRGAQRARRPARAGGGGGARRAQRAEPAALAGAAASAPDAAGRQESRPPQESLRQRDLTVFDHFAPTCDVDDAGGGCLRVRRDSARPLDATDCRRGKRWPRPTSLSRASGP